VLWDGGGNVTMQLPITRELVRRGHEVRMLASTALRDKAAQAGAEFVPFDRAPDVSIESRETDPIRDWEARTPIGAFARFRDGLMFGPSLGFAQDVIAELERRPADVVAYDFLLYGVGAGTERAAIPSAALIHIVYPLPVKGVPPFGQGLRPARWPLGRIRDAILTRAFELNFAPGLKSLNAARMELGLEELHKPWEQLDRVNRALVLTSPEFDFASRAELPPNVRYAGPVIERDPGTAWESPWAGDDARPLVLASFSTTFQDQRKLAGRVMEELGDLSVRALLTTGPAVDVGGFAVPGNVVVRDFVPHAAVLPEADLVVCHGGLGTVHAALDAGVPVLCIPHGRDQDDNAARVVEAGAGLRLRRGASAARIRSAISTALDDREMRKGAERLGADFAARDGASEVADELERLASER
jgi:MGT family glycosyltransferase